MEKRRRGKESALRKRERERGLRRENDCFCTLLGSKVGGHVIMGARGKMCGGFIKVMVTKLVVGE